MLIRYKDAFKCKTNQAWSLEEESKSQNWCTGVLNIIASGWEKCSQNDNNTILKNYRRILEQFSRMYVGKLVKFKILNGVALLQHKKRASILETC